MEQKRRYDVGGATGRNLPEDITRCIESVAEQPWCIHSFQCKRKRGYGEDGLYCKQHAKKNAERKARAIRG